MQAEIANAWGAPLTKCALIKKASPTTCEDGDDNRKGIFGMLVHGPGSTDRHE